MAKKLEDEPSVVRIDTMEISIGGQVLVVTPYELLSLKRLLDDAFDGHIADEVQI